MSYRILLSRNSAPRKRKLPSAVPKKAKVRYEDTDTGKVLMASGFVPEYRFHSERKWRFDFASVVDRKAIEIEGGIWAYGRHNRPASMLKDMEKYNEAGILGWIVLRYTPQQFREGLPLFDIQRSVYGSDCLPE